MASSRFRCTTSPSTCAPPKRGARISRSSSPSAMIR
jgi:hypothetical protein